MRPGRGTVKSKRTTVRRWVRTGSLAGELEVKVDVDENGWHMVYAIHRHPSSIDPPRWTRHDRFAFREEWDAVEYVARHFVDMQEVPV